MHDIARIQSPVHFITITMHNCTKRDILTPMVYLTLNDCIRPKTRRQPESTYSLKDLLLFTSVEADKDEHILFWKYAKSYLECTIHIQQLLCCRRLKGFIVLQKSDHKTFKDSTYRTIDTQKRLGSVSFHGQAQAVCCKYADTKSIL